MTIGIYCIEHITSGKKYIGKSVNIERRFKEHFTRLRNEKYCGGCNRHLYNAVQRYGWDSFKCFIVEETANDSNLLADREIFWMDFYKTLDRDCGFNLLRDSSSSTRHSPETLKRMSEAKLGEKNAMFGTVGKKSHWYGRKHSREHVLNSVNAKRKYSYKQYSMAGEFIRMFKTIEEVVASGFTQSTVTKVCNGKHKHHKGFVWRKIDKVI